MTNTHWNLYTDRTHSYFTQDSDFQRALNVPIPTQHFIDTLWDRFKTNVNLAAAILPHKMTTNIPPPKPKKLISLRPRGLLKDYTTLRKIITEIAQWDSLLHFNFEVDAWNLQIVDINNRLDLNIPAIDYPPDSHWATTARTHLDTIKQLIKSEEHSIRDTAIKERLVARAEDTITNQSRMLASILNRDYNSIRM